MQEKSYTAEEYGILLGCPPEYLTNEVIEERMYEMRYTRKKRTSKQFLAEIIKRKFKINI